MIFISLGIYIQTRTNAAGSSVDTAVRLLSTVNYFKWPGVDKYLFSVELTELTIKQIIGYWSEIETGKINITCAPKREN